MNHFLAPWYCGFDLGSTIEANKLTQEKIHVKLE